MEMLQQITNPILITYKFLVFGNHKKFIGNGDRFGIRERHE